MLTESCVIYFFVTECCVVFWGGEGGADVCQLQWRYSQGSEISRR